MCVHWYLVRFLQKWLSLLVWVCQQLSCIAAGWRCQSRQSTTTRGEAFMDHADLPIRLCLGYYNHGGHYMVVLVQVSNTNWQYHVSRCSHHVTHLLACLFIPWLRPNDSQRIHPIEGSRATIQATLDDGDTRMTHQTAYKRHVVGTILYIMTMITFFGWFALQLIVTMTIFRTEIDEDYSMSIHTCIVLWFTGYRWNVRK